ncbi:MAG: thioredoxin family protein [Ignavibacteriales bacterium]|nr:thioredoxin family protein [Ignavibacteriales bacterium]
MLKRFFLLIIILLTSVIILPASGIGKKVENFTLEDYNGAKHSLADYKSSKAIVMIFMATQCPVSNAYNERMAQLYKDYSSKGITFVGINSNKQETVEEIKNHSNEHGFKFTILKDWDNKIADKLEASVTPEVYILNNKLEIIYHGRIDDSRREEKATSKDTRTALDALLAGKSVEVQETKAFGCSIKRIQ